LRSVVTDAALAVLISQLAGLEYILCEKIVHRVGLAAYAAYPQLSL